MRLRNLSKPLPLQKLDAAIPRLSPQFPTLSKMKDDAKKQQHGYTGEMKVNYFLDNLTQMYTILHDVYLSVNGKNFQIDSLVIANHSISIVDTKNYSGTITFNTTLKQLIRDDGKIESGFEYPITQVENQKFHLQNWLVQHGLAHIPINYYVAIADPSTIVKVKGDEEEIGKIVVHGAEIHNRIMKNDQLHGQKGVSKLRDHQIGKSILRECGEFDSDMFKTYGMRPKDVLPGVICPDCGLRGMERMHSGWWCSKCRQKHYNAHLNALTDYLLLVKKTITNKECIWFLGLKSRGTATRILKKSGLVYDTTYRYWYKKS